MTVEEFYDWAKANGVEHYEIAIKRDEHLLNNGYQTYDSPELIKDHEEKRIIL